MSRSVEGQKCPACHGYLFDDDDIVYCPVCGAPHHRDCYQALGHCALQAQHGTPQQYKEPESKPAGQTPSANGGKQSCCPACGRDLTGKEAFCPGCGRPVGSGAGFLAGFAQANPFVRLNKNEKLEDDITVGEAAQYVGPSAPRYINCFKKQGKTKKTGWNWGAFLFPQAWFFYRKIYLPGALFFILFLTGTLLTYAFTGLVDRVPEELQRNSSLIANYILQNLTKADMPVLIAVAVGAFTKLAVRIFAGLFGDYFYHKSAFARIRAAKEQEEYTEQPEQVLQKMGWVNIWLGMLGLFGITWLCYFILSLL